MTRAAPRWQLPATPKKRYQLRRHRGASSPLVDAAPVVAHLQRLTAWGLPPQSIADAAGLPLSTVWPRITGATTSPTVHHVTAAAILAVDHRPRPAQRLVLAVGARRRVQALSALGYSVAWVAEQLGLSQANHVTDMVRKPLMTYQRWREIADVYARTVAIGRPGPSKRARLRAARLDWPGPLAWDDRALDDPDASPDLDSRLDAQQRTISAEDACWLMTPEGGGLTLEQAAQRLGAPVESVRKALARRASASRKLTAGQAAELRARRAAGEKLKVLAADYGIDPSTASLAARGLMYRDEIPA